MASASSRAGDGPSRSIREASTASAKNAQSTDKSDASKSQRKGGRRNMSSEDRQRARKMMQELAGGRDIQSMSQEERRALFQQMRARMGDSSGGRGGSGRGAQDGPGGGGRGCSWRRETGSHSDPDGPTLACIRIRQAAVHRRRSGKRPAPASSQGGFRCRSPASPRPSCRRGSCHRENPRHTPRAGAGGIRIRRKQHRLHLRRRAASRLAVSKPAGKPKPE